MYNTTGNFTISLTVTDANGETDTYEATIEVMEEE
jgi:PKD repeat protein